MKKTAMLEMDYALHTLFYKAAIYARNRYSARKQRQKIQYYGLLLKYPREEIDRHIGEHRRKALNVRKRKEKACVKYPSLPNDEPLTKPDVCFFMVDKKTNHFKIYPK